MGLILEILGVISIIAGIVASLTVIGLPWGLGSIFGGIFLFAIGSTHRTVKKLERDLAEIKIWLQPKR